jgi:release factor glutamine methyltransferase
VFVPRRRTELLVRSASELLGVADRSSPLTVVDLCCGSGAVGAALQAAFPPVELHSVDIDASALRSARRNLIGPVYQGDLYRPLPPSLRGRVDVLVANAPYVPTGSIPFLSRDARLHEAWVALDGGSDGLDVPSGRLLVETSERQAPQLVESFLAHGLVPLVTGDAGLDATVVLGRRREPSGGDENPQTAKTLPP